MLITCLLLSIGYSKAEVITVTATGKVSSFPGVLAETIELEDLFAVQLSIDTDLLPESLDGFFVNGAITKLRIKGPSGIDFVQDGNLGLSELGFGNLGDPKNIGFNVAPGFNQFPANSEASLRQVGISAEDALSIDTDNLRATFVGALREATFTSGAGLGGFSIGVNLTTGLNTSDIVLETQHVSVFSSADDFLIVDDGAGNSRPIADNSPSRGSVWSSLAQSFAAPYSRMEFGFRLFDPAATSSSNPSAGKTIVYNLYEGENTYTNLLSTKSVQYPDKLSPEADVRRGDVGFVSVSFADVELVVGNQYTVEITVPDEDQPELESRFSVSVWTSLNSPYFDGRFYLPGSPSNSFFADQDLLFKITKTTLPPPDFTYDAHNRLQSTTYPNGTVITYTWDDASNLEGVSYTLADPANDSDADTMSDGWEQANGLNPLNAADAASDTDGDGMSNAGEFAAGTDPRDPLSLLRIDSFTATVHPGSTLIRLAWDSSVGQTFRIEESGDLKTWNTYQEGVPGSSSGTWIDVASTDAKHFYQVFLENGDIPIPARIVPAQTQTNVTTAKVELTWPSVAGKAYAVERSFDLKNWFTVASSIPATSPQNIHRITTVGTKAFFRVRLANNEDTNFGGGTRP